MPAPKEILDLVERFERNLESYKNGKYNETQLRREFLDPFFEILGWDVNNRQGWAEAYKEVIHEDAVKVGGATKAPDYSFRIGGVRKFFVEAKKPSINIKDDFAPAFQLRRYAWSAKLPLSIVTDFEEFAVYDCRGKPDKIDKPSTGRTLYLTFRQYAERWDEIAAIFAKDAVLKGSFDKYAESHKAKRGTAEVDDAFLREIESWRDLLAKNLALRNPQISCRELNFAVQVTLDRIIFLRICEDRGIEPYGRLQALLNGNNVYGRLKELFYHADDRYNSGLFHFRGEKGETDAPDRLTPGLVIDDKALKDILRNLYYPDCPYEFYVLPADILGQVYEQFLGKVIRLTAGHRAVVEAKPEVRKAGGVFYTPTYIVDYIVQNTVGRQLAERTPKEAEKLRIIDPACGSGSFLLGAYQYLLDWHLKWYCANDPDKWAKGKRPALYQGYGGDWRLTTTERKRILLNNIHGVDIDTQAVEVTKLSLLLKVLEGETEQSLNSQMSLFHERALPNLGSNIKCGNSLIGPDFYSGEQFALLGDEEERSRVNAFDWQAEFSEVFKAGGFDAVIGNPPYLYSAGKQFQGYFSDRYILSQYQTDYYLYFIEKALALGKLGGKISYIVPDSWLNSESFTKLRECLLCDHKIDALAMFNYFVFKGVSLENSIFVLELKGIPEEIKVCIFKSPDCLEFINEIDPLLAQKRGIIDLRQADAKDLILSKIECSSNNLKEMFRVNRGIHAYRTDGYGKSRFSAGFQTEKDKETQSYHSHAKDDDTYLLEIKGKDVFRYCLKETNKYLSYGPWLAEPRTPEFFYNKKIVVRKILGNKLSGTYIEEPMALDQSLYIIIQKSEDLSDLIYLLGILLSGLGAWYLKTKYSIYDSLYPWYTKKQLENFPVKKRNDHIVEMVEQMLVLHKQLAGATTSHEQTLVKRQIDALDRQIDRLVYELYGLTEEEIAIVEGGGS